MSLLCKGSRELCPGGVGEQANRAPQQQDLVRGDSQQVLCLLIDRVEYSAVQAEPNYLAWKMKLLSTAAKLSLCHRGGDLKISNPELYIWILPASLFWHAAPEYRQKLKGGSSGRANPSVGCILSMALSFPVAAVENCKGQCYEHSPNPILAKISLVD